MKLEVGTHCPFHIEEGVMIDFVEDQWLILIKDAVWQDEEIKAGWHFCHWIPSCFLPSTSMTCWKPRICRL